VVNQLRKNLPFLKGDDFLKFSFINLKYT
jgi:hypothetical protein